MHRIAEDNDVYTEEEVKAHIKTILAATLFMHSHGVVHRDLKPENIMLSDKTAQAEILIADFGLGRFISKGSQVMETVCGTHHYLVRCAILLQSSEPLPTAAASMSQSLVAAVRAKERASVQAPELVKCDRGEMHAYDRSVDVWGIGLIAFIMLFGYNPFLRESNMATHEAIVTCKYNFPKDDNASKLAKDLIRKMVCLDPGKRISLEGALNHPYFKENTGASKGALRVNNISVRAVMKEYVPLSHTCAACTAILPLASLRVLRPDMTCPSPQVERFQSQGKAH